MLETVLSHLSQSFLERHFALKMTTCTCKIKLSLRIMLTIFTDHLHACIVIVIYGLNSFFHHFLDSYENLLKTMNQKKKRQSNQDCHDQGRPKEKNAKK